MVLVRQIQETQEIKHMRLPEPRRIPQPSFISEKKRAATEEVAKPKTSVKAGSFLVSVRRFPKNLMNNSCIECIFEQAGLEKHVTSYTCDGTCVAIVLSSLDAATACVRHFNGCTWGDHGSAVASLIQLDVTSPQAKASKIVEQQQAFAVGPPTAKPSRAIPSHSDQRLIRELPWFPEGSPAYVHISPSLEEAFKKQALAGIGSTTDKKNRTYSGVSSTTASDSD